MSSLENFVSVEGYITDPQLRGDENKVLTFAVVVNESYLNKDKERIEEQIFVKCVAFGKQAEYLNKNAVKGTLMRVVGSLNQNSWTTAEGQNRDELQVKINSFKIYTTPEEREILRQHRQDKGD